MRKIVFDFRCCRVNITSLVNASAALSRLSRSFRWCSKKTLVPISERFHFPLSGSLFSISLEDSFGSPFFIDLRAIARSEPAASLKRFSRSSMQIAAKVRIRSFSASLLAFEAYSVVSNKPWRV